jgi:hypothetical protein
MSDPKKPELDSIKRRRMAGGTRGQETVNQIEHIDSAGARATIGPVLAPGDVVTDNTSTQARLVGVGNICRIFVTADTYVAFGAEDLGAVSNTSTPAILLKTGDARLVSATADYIRTSIALERLEVIKE